MATHTVQPGEVLSKIANLFYGDPKQWPRIFEANRDVIGPNPNVIRPGMVLVIPDVNGQHPPQPAGQYVFPVEGYRGRVQLHHGSHPGAADLFADPGTRVLAMRGGQVLDTGTEFTDPHGGNNVSILGDDGLTYYYAHGDRAPQVAAGHAVGTGTFLFGVGDTGNAQGTGAHLHIGIGFGIQDGIGPAGGAGINFDAVELMRAVLAGSPQPRREGSAKQFVVVGVGHLGLNVRAQPSHSAPILASLKNGASVDGEDTIVPAEGRNWRRVHDPDGWAADEFLAPV